MNNQIPNTMLGTIIGGSLNDGLTMRLDAHNQLETIKTGKFVCIYGQTGKFFSLITDISLHVTHPDIVLYPPTDSEQLLQKILSKKSMYATAQLKPLVMLNAQNHSMPVKTIPAHFSKVYEATPQDIAYIFGNAQDPSQRYFTIGSPLDMATVPVCINLEKLTERSTGIFGKTGTGKTFITRLVLAGLMNSKKAVCLIFDMHSEYGLQARRETTTYNTEQTTGPSFVKGLKTLFPNRVAIFSLDPISTRKRGGSPDVELTLTYQDIQVEDILSLQQELQLHATALEAAYLIHAKYQQDWLHALLNTENIKDFAQNIGAHPESIAALYRKLKRIERLPFLKPRTTETRNTSIPKQILEYLARDITVSIEFGNYTSTFCYLLISNIITRAIHTAYIEKTEKFLGSQKIEDEPTKLIICIEEAHKFLNPLAASQTIFGIIAREMRKYYVSLLIVDQRPSGIDDEILSQLGTKIVAQLNDEKDIQAILTGTPNSTTLRSVLATLDSKKQALLLGHAVTMPIVIQTREYDENFYADMQHNTHIPTNIPTEQLIQELY